MLIDIKKKQFRRTFAFVLCFFLLFIRCSDPHGEEVFVRIDEHVSSVDFVNHVQDSDSIHLINFHYLYNGGGVGVGDFNRDGLQDLVFGGNQVSSKLYLNKGDFKFQDISINSGFQTEGWVNGISIVDINNDLLPDIYLSVGGYKCEGQCKNYLFLNQFNGEKLKFTEVAEEYGLEDGLYTQQALFFDADQDEDLDVYLLRNYIDPNNKNYPRPKRYFSQNSRDALLIREEYRDSIIYVDRSDKFGIDLPGYGLGVALTDINNDMKPDIYVTNDFISDDIIWMNTTIAFEDKSKDILSHTSYNSMGVDIADVNNDGREDIMVVDMLPYTNDRQKTMLGKLNYDKYLLTLREDYNAQVVKNTLQIHNGHRDGQVLPMSDLAYTYNVDQTDWSWAPLLADFTNDGYLDLYITNGYGSNITDLDFINSSQKTSPFGNSNRKEKEVLDRLRKQPPVLMQNQFFSSQANSALKNLTEAYFPDHPTISNGAAYADLDNDGDLDIINNNINQTADIYENTSEGNYIQIELVGSSKNKQGIGAKIWVYGSRQDYYRYASPVRGYLSSVDPIHHIGLHPEEIIDSVKVIWPDGQETTHKEVSLRSRMTMGYGNSKESQDLKVSSDSKLFSLDRIYDLGIRKGMHSYGEQPLQLFDEKELFAFRHLMKKDGGIIAASRESMFFINDEFTAPEMYEGDSIIGRITDSSEYHRVYYSSDNQVVIIAQPKEESSQVNLYGHDDLKPIGSLDLPIEWNYLSAIDVRSKESGWEIVASGLWSAPILCSLDTINQKVEFSSSLSSLVGMWRTVLLEDIDQDGDTDILLGGLGNNSKLSTSQGPLPFCIKDIDGNGDKEYLLGCKIGYGKDEIYPYHTLDDIASRLPAIRDTYQDYESFGETDWSTLLEQLGVDDDQILYLQELESILLINNGNEGFAVSKLPEQFQYAPINDFELADLNNDGYLDIIAAPNDYTAESNSGRFDASLGMIALGSSTGVFSYLHPEKSGVDLSRDLRKVLYSEGDVYFMDLDNNIIKYSSRR